MEQMAKVLRLLEGNGQPGLLQRQTVMEQAVTAIQEDLKAHSATLGMMEKNQGHLQDLVERHMDSNNPEHQTIARAIRKDPKGVLFWFALAAAALLLANQTGFLAAALRLLGIPNL